MSADEANSSSPVPEVDRLIHEPARYGIVALLYVVARAEFLFVQNQTGLTPGNLSAHVIKLETAGYVVVEKKFVGRRPKTLLSLSRRGRRAFEDYRETMKALLASPPVVSRPDVAG